MKKIKIVLIILAPIVLGITPAIVTWIIAAKASNDNLILNEPTFEHVEAYGSLPDEFEKTVSENRFFNSRSNKYGIVSVRDEDYGQRVRLYDKYGNKLTELFEQWREYHMITFAEATDDGGIILVNGFVWWYYDTPGEESDVDIDKEMATFIVKYDKNGEKEWEVPIEKQEGYELVSMFERNGFYYAIFHCTVDFETGEFRPYLNENRTTASYIKISKCGELIKYEEFLKYRFLWIDTVKVTDDYIILNADAIEEGASEDIKYSYKDVYLNDDMKVKKIVNTGIYAGTWYLGCLNGENFYSKDFFIKDFHDGYVTSVTDYGDFFIVVSENAAGLAKGIENVEDTSWYYRTPDYLTPKIERNKCITETVYGAYDKKGKLLWRASVDSSDLRYHDYIENYKY